MGTNEFSQPASKSSWDSQDFGDVNMVLKLAHFHKSSRPQWVKHMGSSDLYKGIILATFRVSGNTPSVNGMLQIWVSGSTMEFNASLRNCKLISSCPVAEYFRALMILLISVTVTGDRKNVSFSASFIKLRELISTYGMRLVRLGPMQVKKNHWNV